MYIRTSFLFPQSCLLPATVLGAMPEGATRPCIQFSDAIPDRLTAWICLFVALAVCFPAYAFGADPPQRLPEVFVFRPWCILDAQMIRMFTTTLWRKPD